MKKMLLALWFTITALQTIAQQVKKHSLVHTRLDVSFDYKKCYLYGREWVKLRPYAYSADSVQLDAKGMIIREVSLVTGKGKQALHYSYDGMVLAISLGKAYSPADTYTLYIDYTARPNELKGRRREEKGLYFINPDSSEDKPVQIWTEGEPENASVWFPTIDNPNQRTTSEISMTVPAKYTTLSNGYLATQKNNADGTRTDTWKMDKPHAPYLFMMAVGDFRIYKDYWHGKEISYYLEPDYAPYARDIFGQTPESVDFFSRLLGVDFPWNKYAQIVVRDYVSGAMENTTATMTGEAAQGNTRQLADRYYDTGIQHELFHQWFGDYVTAKNWANLCMNESFADLGELLWLEYKYGADAAGEHWHQGLKGYLDDTANAAKPLVNYAIEHPREIFNGVTYQKGGRILYMLRNYLGNDVFNKGLHLYLVQNAYKNAEAAQLRLAMEEASGIDLQWFFDQWFYGAGHPVLDIRYEWDAASRTATVFIEQLQPGHTFRLPLAVDIYAADGKQREQLWLYNRKDTFHFKANQEPLLVNVDADKVLVSQKQDHKTMQAFAYQFFHAPLFMDRCEALEAAAAAPGNDTAQQIITAALKDRFPGIRKKALAILTQKQEDIRNTDPALQRMTLPLIAGIAASDSNTLVQARAITTLAVLKDSAYLPAFIKALSSISYQVQAAALTAIAQINPPTAIQYAKSLEKDNLGVLSKAIAGVYSSFGDESQWSFMYNRLLNGSLRDKAQLTQSFAVFVGRIHDPALAQQGIELMKQIAIRYKQKGAGTFISGLLVKVKEQRTGAHDEASAAAAENAIQAIAAAL
ncbi:MAG TPA: M1 family metallopeptidase [Chitinophaga sp.]|uniref:M1 family metallopeptidase n=1 Tax=Chitinophaga sp. TaxID=1869181 RepID=UPI002F947C46